MKKIAYLMLFTMLVFLSCKKDKTVKVHSVTVQLAYPATSSLTVTADVVVKLTGKGTSFEAKTNVEGKAIFNVPTDIYEVSATDSRSNSGSAFIYNGVKSNVAIVDGWSADNVIKLDLIESKTSQIVIKELFMGGTPADDTGVFNYDRYVVLYNNSNTAANLDNLCLATVAPYNAQLTNNAYYGADGKLTYENENWMPAGQAIWYFQKNVVVEPGKQIVIALANSLNNTITYSKSVNLNNAAYYATYDLASFDHAATYRVAGENIPTDHYLKTVKYGTGAAWALSNTSPGFFIFNPQNTTPVAFGNDVSQTSTITGYVSRKVPTSWIVDGVESYLLNNSNNKKRFLPSVDAGYVYHVNGNGYSLYRNVDEQATKAIAGNEQKLVHNYQFGTTAVGGTTDPSGIDAEASIRNGARIIYKDTNNSTNDFHLRSRASLRTN
ncbi:MAG: DUF4876 domain-containing protein [Pedobacter sp.]|uniref:DUF4876 domain-containing protein n=1 Tax=Pedobacter sp. TaxID=1411316 RepID=UPI0028099A5E|nr:DUF4876 domain-containing protein [Pedobacter sp.]MDQ8006587.1 DUF4876 domain-containing protein [Pedobacter sp.]